MSEDHHEPKPVTQADAGVPPTETSAPSYIDNLNGALEIFGKGVQTAASAVGAFTLLNSEAANLLKTLELLKNSFDLFNGSIKSMIDLHEKQTAVKQ